MGKLKVPDPNEKIGECTLGEQVFELVRSQTGTIQRAAKKGPWAVLSTYRVLTGDTRSRVDFRAALAVVQGAVQEEWYRCQEIELPERCVINQKQRIETAMSTEANTSETGTATGPKTAKIAGVIRDGLKEGKATADIVADVQAAFPESKADGKTVAFYRHQLRQEGVLPKFARKPKGE